MKLSEILCAVSSPSLPDLEHKPSGIIFTIPVLLTPGFGVRGVHLRDFFVCSPSAQYVSLALIQGCQVSGIGDVKCFPCFLPKLDLREKKDALLRGAAALVLHSIAQSHGRASAGFSLC